jgi:transcriptional regulator with PAS, ATPase and Fis domain
MGITHEGLGVLPRAYISQFSKWPNFIYPELKKVIPPDKFPSVLVSLFKNILLDIMLWFEAYEEMREQSYNMIFDAIDNPLVAINMETESINMLNQKMAELLEVPKESLLGKSLLDICSDDIRNLSKDEIRQVYLIYGDKKIPVTGKVNSVDARGKRYAIYTFQDMREEIRRKDEFDVLERFYNALSAINMLITTVGDRDELFKRTVDIIRENAELKYIGIFEKEGDVLLYEKGSKLLNL